MTVSEIARTLSTLDQLDLFMRADVVLREKCGRYYGGALTVDEAARITPVKQTRVQSTSGSAPAS